MAWAYSSSSTSNHITDNSSSNSTVLDAITGTTDQAITSAQLTAEQAIKATGEAYAESKSELRNFIDAVRPIALYAAIAAVFYYIFAKGK